MAFQIEQASRKNSKLVIGLVGESGSGKTLSGILLALGMAKSAGGNGRVLVVDTENGRASLYADEPMVREAGGFDIIRLDAPFTPERYAEAVASGEAANYPVILIDSISHEWNNTGGILEAAENSPAKSDFAKWNGPKKRHNKFFHALLQSKAHIVLCYRAKEKYKQVPNEKTGKMEVVSIGTQPIQNAEMIYDMTVSFLMEETLPTYLKVPSMLQAFFPKGQRIGIAQGQQLIQWVQSGGEVDERYEALRVECRAAAEGGMKSLAAWFGALSNPDKLKISTYKDECKSIATVVDTPTEEEQTRAETTASAAAVGEALESAGVGRPRTTAPTQEVDIFDPNPSTDMPTL